MNDNISEQGCQRIKYGKNAYLSFISSISSAEQSIKLHSRERVASVTNDMGGALVGKSDDGGNNIYK